jgi:hypothetical protein
MEKKCRGGPWGVVFAALLAACAYRGADNPVALRLSWFDYLNGGDLRGLCVAGAPERYRFVYNAVNTEQIRRYEVGPGAAPGTHLLRVNVIGPPDLSQVMVGRPGDLAGPWRGTSETVHLRIEDVALLRRAATSGGVFAGAPTGLRLASKGFFWTVAACVGGRFSFNAYRWPSRRFEDAAFAPLLFAWDPTGVTVNEPRRIIEAYDKDGADNARRYTLDVGVNGLVGAEPLF